METRVLENTLVGADKPLRQHNDVVAKTVKNSHHVGVDAVATAVDDKFTWGGFEK